MQLVDSGRSQDDVPPPHRGWIILAALVLAELVSSFEASMIYAALKQFHAQFDDPIGIGWLLTGFMLVASASAAIGARLGDIYGRKRVLMICLAFAMAGSLVSAASTDLVWIVIGRSCQGFAGPILPLCFGMVREYFPRARAALNIGIVAATASGGAGIGLVIGGMLVDHGSWRLIFVASALLAAAAIAAIGLLTPRSRQFSPGRIDWIGGIMFLPGIVLFLYAIGLGEDHGWGSPQQLLPLAAGGAILAAWFRYEARTTNPLIDVRMLADRQIGLTLLIMMMFAIGVMNIAQIVMVMLQQPTATGVGFGLSATTAGLLHAPASVMGVLAGPLCGWYAGRRGGRNAMIGATALATAMWIGLTLFHEAVPMVFLWMIGSSFALGAAMAAAPNLIVEAAPEGRTSEATGLAQIARKVAMATGAQVVAISLATSTIPVEGGSYPDESAYLLTCILVSIACATAFLLSLCLPSRRAPLRSAEPPVAAVLGAGAA